MESLWSSVRQGRWRLSGRVSLTGRLKKDNAILLFRSLREACNSNSFAIFRLEQPNPEVINPVVKPALSPAIRPKALVSVAQACRATARPESPAQSLATQARGLFGDIFVLGNRHGQSDAKTIGHIGFDHVPPRLTSMPGNQSHAQPVSKPC